MKKKEKQIDLFPPSEIQKRDIGRETKRVESVKEQKKNLKEKVKELLKKKEVSK